MAYEVAIQKRRVAYMKKEMVLTVPVRYKKVDAKELLEAAGRNNGIKEGTLYNAVHSVLNEFKNFLLKGHPVVIPELGTFKLKISAHAAETKEEAGVAAIYRKGIQFTPTADLKEAVNRASVTVLQHDIITMSDDPDEEEGPTP